VFEVLVNLNLRINSKKTDLFPIVLCIKP
jgi:hypothetical protein